MFYVRLLTCLLLMLAVGCTLQGSGSISTPTRMHSIAATTYFDKLHGAWQATMVANHTGLVHEGKYLQEPSAAESIELVLLDEWSTDDDTSVEWVDLHIMETHGLDPTYEQIRDEWVAHLNNDIWVSALKARQLMDEGVIPPLTSDPELNPEGVWSIGAQLQTELFGLIAPGLPDEASQRAIYFARVTNSGLAVEVSAFYTTMYANAFFESDIPTLINIAQAEFAPDSQIYQIVGNVQQWHQQHPNDWRATRQNIRDSYDDDPMWWAAKVNFASTIMALLYGENDMMKTLTIAALAGWDADNNMTTSAGLLGIILGFDNLPEPMRSATDIYFNQDVTGDLPQYQTVPEIAKRTQRLGEIVIFRAGGWMKEGVYYIPRAD